MTEPDQTTASTGDTGPAPSLWVRWRLQGLIAFAIVGVGALLYTAIGAILPLIISIILADLLFPIVSYIEAHLPGYRRYPSVARLVAIAVVYLVFFALLAFFIYITFPANSRRVPEIHSGCPPAVREGEGHVRAVV